MAIAKKPESIDVEKVKKAIKAFQQGKSDQVITATVFLIKELAKKKPSPDIQDLIRHLTARLISECHSMISDIRKKALKMLGKLTDELVKIKDLDALRFIARASLQRGLRRKALGELVKFKDLNGLRMIAQWGRFKEIRFKAIEEMVKLKDIEGLRIVAMWNMYEDTINKAVKELENLYNLLIKSKDRESLKCIAKLSKNSEARKKAIEGLEKVLDEAVEMRDLDTLRFIAAYGRSKQNRLRALAELKDVRSLKFVIQVHSEKGCKDTAKKAVESLCEFINELVRTKDREGLEYIAEFAEDPRYWRRAIDELNRLREVTKEERVADTLHKIFLSREFPKI